MSKERKTKTKTVIAAAGMGNWPGVKCRGDFSEENCPTFVRNKFFGVIFLAVKVPYDNISQIENLGTVPNLDFTISEFQSLCRFR